MKAQMMEGRERNPGDIQILISSANMGRKHWSYTVCQQEGRKSGFGLVFVLFCFFPFLFLVFSILGSPQEARTNDFSEVLAVISCYDSSLWHLPKTLWKASPVAKVITHTSTRF